MDLNRTALEGLQMAGDSTSIPDKAFGILLEGVIQTALGKDSEDNIKVSGVDLAVIKQCYFGLLTLVLEAAKYNADKSNISSVVEECKWAPDRVEFLIKYYLNHKEEIQAELARVGKSHPHVVDLDWRLDYYIKNNYVDKVNEPSYLISLKTEEPGKAQGRDIQFSCSIEQLQDLVSKLKDATKSIEKASQM